MVKIENYQIEPEIFDNPLFGIHLRLMRLYGYIIGTNQSNWLWHFMRCTFFTLSFIVFAILIFIRVMRGIHVLMADFMARVGMVLEFSISIHVLSGYFQRKRVVRLVNFMHQDLLDMRSYSDSLEDEIFSKTVKYLRRLTSMFYIPTLFNAVLLYLQCWSLTILYPEMMYYKVISPEKLNGTTPAIMLLETFPFGEVLDNFILGYLGSCYGLILTNIVVPMFYVFYAVLIKFVIFKFEIIGKRMSEMNLAIFNRERRSKKGNKYTAETEQNILRLKMCEKCAEDLVNIRWFVKDIEKLQRIPIFMDSLVISIILCLLLYILSSGGLSVIEYGYIFVFMALAVGLKILHYWHCTALTYSHEAMSLAIYSCDWYNYPVKIQKAIHHTMMDISRPLMMSALLVDLNLSTVVDFFRGAFGYYSVLKNLKN